MRRGGLVVMGLALAVLALALPGCGEDLKAWRIPAESMLPTLKLGAIVESDPAKRVPSFGQLVAFHPPASADALGDVMCGNPAQGGGHKQVCSQPVPGTSKATFIKRVVGMPGDRIALVNGIVIRNGTRLREPYITACPADEGDVCSFPRPVTIPAGTYFVLGDNRAASDDSRFWGPVRKADILGVIVRCHPSRRYCTHA